jgi:hypothetical protein
MKTIFALTCSLDHDTLQAAQFYSSKRKAHKALQVIADKHRGCPDVEVHDDRPELFTFLFKWDENLTTYTIIELTVE